MYSFQQPLIPCDSEWSLSKVSLFSAKIQTKFYKHILKAVNCQLANSIKRMNKEKKIPKCSVRVVESQNDCGQILNKIRYKFH